MTYGSDESIELMEKVMGSSAARVMDCIVAAGSGERSLSRSSTPNRDAYAKFIYDELGIPRDIPLTPRNYEVTTSRADRDHFACC